MKKNYQSEIEIEEIFLDKHSKEREKEVSLRKLEVPLKKINFLILLILGTATIGLLWWQGFNLQFIQRSRYQALAKNNQYITSYLTAERGIIYDRKGKKLAWNELSFDLWLEKSQLPSSSEKILKEVAEIIEENPDNLKEKIKNSKEKEILIKKNLSHRSLILLATRELPGFKVKKRILRIYQSQGGLGHILGYLGKISAKELKQFEGYQINDYIGKEGVERSYEKVLRERKGEVQIKRTAQGKEIATEIKSFPQSGDSLVLSLDFSLQKRAEEALRNVLNEVGSKKGAVVVLNPQNGQILASVSFPYFDNNLFSQGISLKELEGLREDKRKPLLNRVIAGTYQIGSTVKPLIGSAALEEKIISQSEKLYCPLELCLEQKYSSEKKCFSDWRFHGWTDIKKAIAESVNPFFYIIGGGYTAPSPSKEFFDPRLPRKFEGLGVTKIAKYLKLFGLGQKTGVDLPGEVEGRVPTPEWKKEYFSDRPQAEQIWYLGDTYHLSIGQGYLLATPLQIATAFQAFANGGKIFKPKIAKEILDVNGNLKQKLEPEVLRQNFISQNSLKIIKEGMLKAVTSPSGSAFSLSSLPVRSAAKTGTAQIYPNREIYNNWITVFAPYQKPEILITVVIEEVKGTRVAAQKVAYQILNWYFTQK